MDNVNEVKTIALLSEDVVVALELQMPPDVAGVTDTKILFEDTTYLDL